jgi:hypothetical protein
MTTWHADPDLLVRYAAEPVAVDPVTASSIEQHLLGCAECRARVAAAEPADELSALWDEIADRIDRRAPSITERLLLLVGIDPGLARLVSATPMLRIQAIVATFLVSIGAALLSRAAETDGVFLAIAPLILLAATALAFAPGADPTGEAGQATPLHGFGLFIRRATIVLSTALTALVLASLTLPGSSWTALAWVAPALALALGTLALATRTSPVNAAAGLAVAWIAVVQATVLLDRGVTLADSRLFAPVGTALAGGLALLFLVLLVLWRDDLDRGLSQSAAPGRFL